VGEQPGDDVGHEHRAERQEDVLDAAKVATQHEQRDRERGDRNAHVARDAGKLERGGDAGEFGARGAHVGHEEGEQAQGGHADSVALANKPGQALPRHDAHARAKLVEEDERHGGQQQHPQQPVAIVSAEDRVGGDARRIVVGEPGQQAGPEDRQQRERNATAPHAAGEERGWGTGGAGRAAAPAGPGRRALEGAPRAGHARRRSGRLSSRAGR
jgi:hypothetical protein